MLVIVTTSFPVVGDGREAAGSFVSDLAQELAQQVSVRVVAPGARSIVETWTTGVEVFRYAAPPKALSTLKLWKPSDVFQIARTLRGGAEATMRATTGQSLAHILALWVLPSGYWARAAARRNHLSYSVWALGSDIWSLGRIPLARVALREVIRGATNRYADGLRLGDDAARISGKPFTFLPSTRRIGSHDSRPLASSPPYRMLFLGRWHANKGVDLLLDALALLSDDDWTRVAALEICGGGPLESRVRAGVDKLRLAGRPVELRGYLDKDAAEDAILRADYLLIPSRIESIPLVFSDAMKLGRPVVSMPVGDLPSLIASSMPCGLLAKEISAEAFAIAISRALAQKPMEFLAGAKNIAAKFDLTAVAKRILADINMSTHG